MRPLSVILSAFLVFSLSGCHKKITLPSTVQETIKQYKSTTVYGDRTPWTRTGLKLNPGDHLLITASGEVNVWPVKRPNMPPAKLLYMKIGGKAPAQRAVGRENYQFHVATDRGPLWLCVKDWDRIDASGNPVWNRFGGKAQNYYRGNTGSYRVDVFVFATDNRAKIMASLETLAKANAADRTLSDQLRAAAGLPSIAGGATETAGEIEQETAGRWMTVEEAKKVTVTVDRKSFRSPPRRIDDVLKVFEQRQSPDVEKMSRKLTEATALPPGTENRDTLMKFYMKRGYANRELGRYTQCLQDYYKAHAYAVDKDGRQRKEVSDKRYSKLLTRIAQAEANAGNLSRALDLLNQSLAIYPRAGTYIWLAAIYREMGDFDSFAQAVAAGIEYCNIRLASRRPSSRQRTGLEMRRAIMTATLLETQGYCKQAESYRRSIIRNLRVFMADDRDVLTSYINNREMLVMNLTSQGRLVEAEMEARECLKEAVRLTGKSSGTSAEMLGPLGLVLFRQGRLTESEKICTAAVQQLKACGYSESSYELLAARRDLANVYAALSSYQKAMDQYLKIKTSLTENPYLYKKYIAGDPLALLSMLKTGRHAEAMQAISSGYTSFSRLLGETDPFTRCFVGLRAMAHRMDQNDRQALADFSKAAPEMVSEIHQGSRSHILTYLADTFAEEYLTMLRKIYTERREKEFGINAAEEIFLLSQRLHEGTVHRALGASSARAAAEDTELAELARKEQDAARSIDNLQATLSHMIALPDDQLDAGQIQDLQRSLDELRSARQALLDEIENRFPRYASIAAPRPVDYRQVQSSLHPGETLLAIFSSAETTFVWAIPFQGAVQFAPVAVTVSALQRKIQHLRVALEPHSSTLGQLPAFDVQRAHDLYRLLIPPVIRADRLPGELLVVVSGPLAQMPLAVLPTAPVGIEPDRGQLFAEYRQVPWLVRRSAIARLPSVASLTTLRSLPPADPGRKVFAGFGDPIFNKTQLVSTGQTGPTVGRTTVTRGKSIRIRGIRFTEQTSLDDEHLLSAQLEQLKRLPDTADELQRIADILNADPSSSLFLGKNASERRIKTMNLSDRRIIAFASHALIPGDLDGLDQPAIALSSPAVTQEKEDGLLTTGEILNLNLNADWVILSACNTGAADGAGAEAISGLGRAFFYAGTRSLLVSMWPVESSSATELTTGLFRRQQKNSNLSRSSALQRTMLDLLDRGVMKDPASGRLACAYAHPIFWAPFILVGDSR